MTLTQVWDRVKLVLLLEKDMNSYTVIKTSQPGKVVEIQLMLLLRIDLDWVVGSINLSLALLLFWLSSGKADLSKCVLCEC